MWILELKGLTACVSLKGDQKQFSPSSNISTKSREIVVRINYMIT